MDNQLVVVHFDTVESAESTMSTIRTLEAEGFLQLDDAALITRAESGGVTVTPAGPTNTARATSVGAIIGLVAGSLIGLPVLGGLAGAGIRANRSTKNTVDQLDRLLDDVGRRVEAGSTVLALAIQGLPDIEVVRDRLAVHRSEMTQVDIPAELREQIEGSTTE
jgi:uncharacterized membrane protein